jgi:hypothetical protein
MNHQLDFASVQQALTAAQTILVVAPEKPSFDNIAAALALFLSLKKMGKTVDVACPDEMTVEFSSLVGVDKVSQKLGGKNLIISFDYLEDSIEKVSYNIENNKFNLLIQPKAGFPPLSPEKVSYTHSGGADLIFVIGAQKWEDLSHLSAQEKEASNRKPVINIDIDPKNVQFGKINLTDPTLSSCSEIIAGLFSTLKWPIDQDIATNLLLGIEEATQGFTSPQTNASTFEMTAFCLRAGGRRAKNAVEAKPKGLTPLSPMPSRVSAKKPPEEAEEEEKPSADWFEPKIFKGSTRV